MIHTEGYIDHECVDADLHMVSLAGSVENRDILVWAVWKDRALLTANQERLREWFLSELGPVTGRSEEEILKELLRISSGLKCRLYLYYGQKLYRAGEHVEEGRFYMDHSLGANVYKEGSAAPMPLEKELDRMKQQMDLGNACVSESETPQIRALGNIWQRNIMDCVAQDGLSYAYFMLWETR